MLNRQLYFVMVLLIAMGTTSLALAAEGEAPKKTRAKMLQATPVNINIAGGGSLPEGRLLTILNASFADKNHTARGGGDPANVYQQAWLLKIRYGITNQFEISATTPYVNLERYNPKGNPKHLEGIGDQVIQLVWAPYNLHQKDPVALSFTGGFLLPTGNYGKNHIPGNGAWGGRAAAAIGAFVTPDIKVDTEVVWSGPFARGNREVRRGDQFQWNSQARYLFDNFDIGVESVFTKQDSGNTRGVRNRNQFDLRNGYTEWLIGPSFNIPIDYLGMWAGAGVFFPVMQDAKGPAKMENSRFEFKIGKLW